MPRIRSTLWAIHFSLSCSNEKLKKRVFHPFWQHQLQLAKKLKTKGLFLFPPYKTTNNKAPVKFLLGSEKKKTFS